METVQLATQANFLRQTRRIKDCHASFDHKNDNNLHYDKLSVIIDHLSS